MYEITAALSSIKSISDIAAFFLSSTISVEVRQKAIELQTVIITLQNSMMSVQAQNQELMTENRQLKEQLASAHNWEEEARKHQLVEIDAGVFVYVPRLEHIQAGDPICWLCTNCYQKKQKSILQKLGRTPRPGQRGYEYTCPNCNAHFATFKVPSKTNIEEELRAYAASGVEPGEDPNLPSESQSTS